MKETPAESRRWEYWRKGMELGMELGMEARERTAARQVRGAGRNGQ